MEKKELHHLRVSKLRSLLLLLFTVSSLSFFRFQEQSSRCVFDPFMDRQRTSFFSSLPSSSLLKTRKINLLSRNFSYYGQFSFLCVLCIGPFGEFWKAKTKVPNSLSSILGKVWEISEGYLSKEKLFLEENHRVLKAKKGSSPIVQSHDLVFLEIPMVLYMHNRRLTFFCGKRIPGLQLSSRPSLPQYGSIFNFLQS